MCASRSARATCVVVLDVRWRRIRRDRVARSCGTRRSPLARAGDQYDSPGGEVAGCGVCADAIRSAADASGKPVVSYVGEASQRARPTIRERGGQDRYASVRDARSIGVIATRLEEAPDAQGRKLHIIKSRARKADGHPLTAMGKEEPRRRKRRSTRWRMCSRARSLSDGDDARAGARARSRCVRRGRRGCEGPRRSSGQPGLRGRVRARACNDNAETKDHERDQQGARHRRGFERGGCRCDRRRAQGEGGEGRRLEAKLATIEAKQLEADRAAALAEGDAKNVFTPAIRALYASKTAEEIRAFVSVAPRVIAAQETGSPARSRPGPRDRAEALRRHVADGARVAPPVQPRGVSRCADAESAALSERTHPQRFGELNHG